MANGVMGRTDYGQDAPGLVRTFLISGLAAGAAAVAVGLTRWPGGWWGGAVAAGAVLAAYALGMAGFMVYWSRVLKVRRRDRLLDHLPWRGDEAVLDVGCGRGLLLVAVARRVPAGGAVGVDIWQQADQADNRPDAALTNARIEGVAGRVTVETADMRALPCRDGAFDVVVSHWAVHNLPAAADRAVAVREMVRVLKPGGRLLLADIAHHREYARLLADAGMADVREVMAGWGARLGWAVSGGSFRPAAVVAHKPPPV